MNGFSTVVEPYDLAIGNWVYPSDRIEVPMMIESLQPGLVGLFNDEVGEDECSYSEIRGIPLTGELLSMLGFTFKDGLWKHSLGIKIKVETGFVNIENKDKDHWLYGTCSCKDIWYVHQLQNLVRIITKKELTINWQYD